MLLVGVEVPAGRTVRAVMYGVDLLERDYPLALVLLAGELRFVDGDCKLGTHPVSFRFLLRSAPVSRANAVRSLSSALGASEFPFST